MYLHLYELTYIHTYIHKYIYIFTFDDCSIAPIKDINLYTLTDYLEKNYQINLEQKSGIGTVEQRGAIVP